MKYSQWHYGGEICLVPDYVLSELENFFESFTLRTPDQLKLYYKQWYVQTSNVDNQYDITYVHWQDNGLLTNTKKFFSNYVSRMCRFRLSFLDQNQEVDYHSKHQLPRIHIPLNDCLSTMIIKEENEKEYFIPMYYGKAYFTNVTKLHKVTGDNNKVRKNAFFCFTDFVDKNLKTKYSN